MFQNIHPILARYLSDASIEELTFISNAVNGLSDSQIENFCMVYNSRRRSPQIILISCLLGFVGIAGIHRFLINQPGMGLLYFFTGGIFLIGTVVDLLNYKDLAFDYNRTQIAETMAILNLH